VTRDGTEEWMNPGENGDDSVDGRTAGRDWWEKAQSYCHCS